MRPGGAPFVTSTSVSGDDGREHLEPLSLQGFSEGDDGDGVASWLAAIYRAVSESTDASSPEGHAEDDDAEEERRARLEALGVRVAALLETWQRARASAMGSSDGTEETDEKVLHLTASDAAAGLMRFRERCAADEWSSVAAARLAVLAPPEALVEALGWTWRDVNATHFFDPVARAASAAYVGAGGVATGVAAGVRALETGVFAGVAGLRSGMTTVTEGVGVTVQVASEGIKDVGRITKETIGGLGGVVETALRNRRLKEKTSVVIRGIGALDFIDKDDADDVLRDMRSVLLEQETIEALVTP